MSCLTCYLAHNITAFVLKISSSRWVNKVQAADYQEYDRNYGEMFKSIKRVK